MVGPMMMSHGGGPRPGTMEAGMGIIEGGALGESSRPAFGRTLGVGAEPDRPAPNMPLGGMTQAGSGDRQQAMFPGYPQDMFMVMDDLVAKPETYGLRRGWSGGTMGMMTVLRVLQPELFEKIQALKAEQARTRKAR